jgi:predicted dehydrogenase
MKVYSVAVVGVGGMSRGHFQAIESLPEYKLTAVCDIRKEALVAYQDVPEVGCFTSISDMMTQVAPEVVILVAPDPVHAELVCQVASYKPRAILSEKPMSIHYADAIRMVETCEQNEVELLINHQRRLVAGESMRKWILSGALGDVLEMEGRCAGDLIGDGTHLVDSLMAIGGDEPAQKVWGMIDTGHTDGQIEQRYGRAKEIAAAAYWTSESNVRYAVQTGDLANRIPYHSLRVRGSKGELWHPGGNSQPAVFVNDGQPGTHIAALQENGWYFMPKDEEGGPWRRINPEDDLNKAMPISLQLLAKILNGEAIKHPLNGKRTLQVQEILNAAYIAGLQNCSVTLPLPSDTKFPL